MIIDEAVVSYDVSENSLDISRIFYGITHPQTPMLNAIANGNAARATKHYWWEDNLPPVGTTLAGAYTASDGSLTLTDASGLRIGSLCKIGDTVFRCTAAPNYSANTVAVTALSGDDNHDNGSTVIFLNTANLERSNQVASDYSQKDEYYNVTQIITDYAEISGTQQAVNRDVDQGSLIDIETAKKLRRLYYLLGRDIWHNPRISPSDNDTARVFGGIYYWINANGYTPAGAAFSADNIDAFLLECDQTYRCEISDLWMQATDLKRFAGLNTSRIRVDRSDVVTVGTPRPTMYLSEYGYEVNLHVDQACTLGKLALISPSMVRLCPLQTRQFQITDINDDTDSVQKKILGEYTLEINPSKRTAIFEIS